MRGILIVSVLCGPAGTSSSMREREPGWTTFRRRIAAAPAFELRRGRDPAEAADALQALLADGSAAEH